MEYGQEKDGLSKLEYFLIFTLVVILIWASWIMLEPVVRPEIEQFVQRALEAGVDTSTPASASTPTPSFTPTP